jgi:ligand-binding sensor domain-containing protein
MKQVAYIAAWFSQERYDASDESALINSPLLMCRRSTLKISSILSVLFFLGLLLGLAACGDENTVAPPEPPPQLNLKIYKMPVLPDNDVCTILVDSQDRIWFGTDKGIVVLENGQRTYYNQVDGLSNPACRKIVEFNGKFWVATWGGGVAVFDGTDWTALRKKDGLLADEVTDIAVDGTYLWFATTSGVIRYLDDDQVQMSARWTNFTSKVMYKTLSTVLFAPTATRGDELWFGSMYNWVDVWRVGSQENIHYTPTLSDIPGTGVTGIAYNPSDGQFWVAFAAEGVASVNVDSTTWSQYTTEQGLPTLITHAVAVDQDGVVWVGTQTGLGKWNGSKFIAYPRGSGLPAGAIRLLYVDPHNNVWMGFYNDGAAMILK